VPQSSIRARLFRSTFLKEVHHSFSTRNTRNKGWNLHHSIMLPSSIFTPSQSIPLRESNLT
jgi:hypothetical protein